MSASDPDVAMQMADFADGEHPAGLPPAAAAIPASPATILIVDDETSNRKLLEAMLRREQYVIVAVANGEGALAAIAQHAPDLILLDIKLPGMDGYKVARTLKGDPRTSNIPIIMVTVLIDRDTRMAALKAGVEELVTKPIDPNELLLRVRNLLRLKAYGDLLQNHGLNLEQQVQARTADLQRFRSAMDATADAIYLVDRGSMGFLHFNEAACRMQGLTREELLALGPAGVLGIPREKLARTYDAIIASGGDTEPVELLRQRKDGGQAWVELRRHAQRSGDGWTIVTLARDVTDRKKAEDKIRRLIRVYAVLSQINALIVRAQDRDELFREACRIAVGAGGFRLAWMALVDRSSMQLGPVIWEGASQGYIEIMPLSLNGADGEKFGLAGQAVRDKKPLVVDDMANDPRVLLRREARQQGFHSLVMLPLTVADSVVGVLALYANEIDFFNEDEMKLLLELTGHISFAIDHIGRQERLDYLSYYDALTGLANRTLFLERVALYMRTANGNGHKLAVFLVDLERFKNINDSLGQAAGDRLLKQVAEWLTLNAGDAGLVARIGADHFALVLPEVKRTDGVSRLVEKMLAAFLEHSFRLDDGVFRLAAKVGAAIYPDDASDADALLKNTEAALKKAKATGERYLFYTQRMTELVAGRLTLENQLRRALDNDEFVLHYQPKVSLESGKLTSAEALIRWNDPQAGLVPPGRFIPILEETGLIYEVGRWALRKAIDDYLRWRAAGLPAVRVAVNVSPLQLRNRGFISDIRDMVGVDAQAAAGLEIEITESVIMEDVKHNIVSLQAIRAMGISIAIDDFGTGFSSLSHLARLPVDTLKIDRSFVMEMTSEAKGLSLVSTIINLAHALGLKVVAEGVETEEQSRLLRLLRCDEMQGFLFSKAVPGDDFVARFLALPVAA